MMSSTAEPLCIAEQLMAIRGEQVLFRGLNFLLYPGMVQHVIGPNGCGKTTLLHMLAGISAPAAGRITWSADFIYIGHRAGLKPGLTTRENLYYLQALYEKKSNDEIDQALAAVQLDKVADHMCDALSAGQQRRVALARLLLSHAPVWILDEPLNALDQHAHQWLQQCFHRHCTEGGAIIFSSHQTFSLALPVQKLEWWRSSDD
jgi:heme exporter protein A